MAEFDGGRSLPSVPLGPLLDRDPREVGPFRLLGRLGAGGMGVAYLADGLGQWAVVKCLRSELADDVGFRARLGRELEAVGRLNGESARVLQSDLDGPAPWFAMEFIAGQTLSHWVRERGPMTGRQLVDFAAGLAEVIAGVGQAGIVHRDVKPANVMVSPGGPRLIDFGIAEVAEGTNLTTTGSVMGSVGWLAPEQITGERVSSATDVHAWALCVVFAASGEAPFGTDTGAATLYRVLESTPKVPPTVVMPLRGLVERALAKDPESRPTAVNIFKVVVSGGSPSLAWLDPNASSRDGASTGERPQQMASQPASVERTSNSVSLLRRLLKSPWSVSGGGWGWYGNDSWNRRD
jgi:serine/threonine protein kinase